MLTECLAIPHDANLSDFEIFGNLDVRFTWNKETKREDIQLLSQIRFVLYKYDVEIIVKPGFTCDGGSVPRMFWTSVGSPYATRLSLAFILHDAIYAAELFKDHSECDWIFLELMKELGVSWYTRNKVWTAVRACGWYAWMDHTDVSIAEAKTFVKKIDIHIK